MLQHQEFLLSGHSILKSWRRLRCLMYFGMRARGRARVNLAPSSCNGLLQQRALTGDLAIRTCARERPARKQVIRT
eukprot:9249470-Pyramimonas_sp.AAC.1